MFDFILWPIIILYSVYSLFRYFFPPPSISLRGKSVLISGCDSGFGKLLVETLDSSTSPYAKSTDGMKIFAGCLTQNGIDSLRNGCSPKVVPFLLDLTSAESIASVRSAISPHLTSSPLFAIVHNAGIAEGSLIEWASLSHYRRVMEINFFGHLQMTKLFIDDIQRSRGRFVFITSVAGLMAGPGMSAYSSSKFALEAFADALRREMITWGVKVSIHEPFFFRTNIIEGVSKHQQDIYNSLSADVKEKYGDAFLKRVMTTTENIGLISGDPIVVVKDIVHSLISSSPSLRYHSGALSTVAWIISLLPAQALDFMEYIRKWAIKDAIPQGAMKGLAERGASLPVAQEAKKSN